MSLALQMAIATVLGILCGLFLGDVCDIFAPYASAYIMILKITAVPYLIGAIIHGIGQLSHSQAKQILKKGLFFIALAWAINLCIIYTIHYLLPQPAAPQTGGYLSNETVQLNFAELLIPDNIFYDLTHNIVPAIVIFSLLIGIALISIKDKEVIIKAIGDLVSTLTKATSWIARITPWGTFLIIANQVGTIQVSTVKQVSTYIILYIIGVSVLVFWIFPKLTSMLTTLHSYRWLQQLLPILILAYTTNVVIVCLPYIIELLKKETAEVDPRDDKAQNQIQGTVSVVFNLPLGSLFIMAFVFFLSIRYSTPLPLLSQLNLFITTCLNGLGAVGLGSWINSLTFILDSLGLPQESINLYLTTLPFTSGFQSMVSVMEIATISLFITLACRNMLTLRPAKILKQGLLTLVPVLLLFAGIKTFNPLPEVKNETKSIYELNISSAIPITVVTNPTPSSPSEDTFERILRTQTLRVGYNTDVAPFCFFNTDNQIVGYDIAFAYELAYDLGCKLELVPLHYDTLIDELNDRLYDVAMSATSINEARLKILTFTEPYLRPRLCFVVSEKMRPLFASIDALYRDKRVKLAVLKGSTFETAAKELFPHIPLILINSYEEFPAKDPYIALLWEEQEAIAWTLHHRGQRIVFPQPALGFDTIGYALRDDSPRFINYLNQWLELKKTQGFTDKQYDLWIKGKTEIAASNEPRWSVIRNVLHWVN
jgi:Na+/H+-dicarboxylate symporter